MTLEQQQVRDWMKKAGQIVRNHPLDLDFDDQSFRLRLIKEEWEELSIAFMSDDLTEQADALGDLMYVVLGTAVSLGIDLEPVFQEIHRSNMTKLVQDGNGQWTLTKRADGKVLKPASYEPPNLQPIISDQCK